MQQGAALVEGVEAAKQFRVTGAIDPFAALLAGEGLTATGEANCYSVEEVMAWLDATGWTLGSQRVVAR